jgi:hypothetical protein
MWFILSLTFIEYNENNEHFFIKDLSLTCKKYSYHGDTYE